MGSGQGNSKRARGTVRSRSSEPALRTGEDRKGFSGMGDDRLSREAALMQSPPMKKIGSVPARYAPDGGLLRIVHFD